MCVFFIGYCTASILNSMYLIVLESSMDSWSLSGKWGYFQNTFEGKEHVTTSTADKAALGTHHIFYGANLQNKVLITWALQHRCFHMCIIVQIAFVWKL